MDFTDFTDLPAKNVMSNNVALVLGETQLKRLEALQVTELESKEIEEDTRLQGNDPKWHKIRKDRITASNARQIAKRRKGMYIPQVYKIHFHFFVVVSFVFVFYGFIIFLLYKVILQYIVLNQKVQTLYVYTCICILVMRRNFY